MERPPVSRIFRKELEEILEGVDSRKFVVSEVMKKRAAILVQELFRQRSLRGAKMLRRELGAAMDMSS